MVPPVRLPRLILLKILFTATCKKNHNGNGSTNSQLLYSRTTEKVQKSLSPRCLYYNGRGKLCLPVEVPHFLMRPSISTPPREVNDLIII